MNNKLFSLDEHHYNGNRYYVCASFDIFHRYIESMNFTNLASVKIKVFDALGCCDKFDAFVSKKILSTEQICARFKKCKHNVPKYETGSPAILLNEYSANKSWFGKLFHKKDITVADIHLLGNDDIVIDHNMNQIWPVKTGQMPEQLQKILQQSNGR